MCGGAQDGRRQRDGGGVARAALLLGDVDAQDRQRVFEVDQVVDVVGAQSTQQHCCSGFLIPAGAQRRGQRERGRDPRGQLDREGIRQTSAVQRIREKRDERSIHVL
jgi:hypothetical protein